MKVLQRKSNFIHFTAGPVKLFKAIGICLQPPETLKTKSLRILTVFTLFLMLLHKVAYFLDSAHTFSDISGAIGLFTYTTVAVGKLIFVIYNRDLILKNLRELEAIYPSVASERRYQLESYLRIYKRIETTLLNFFIVTLIIFTTYPIMENFYYLWSNGAYPYRMGNFFWHPIPLEDSFLLYVFYTIFQTYCSFVVGLIITATDLCLFGSVSQLMIHLDLLAQRILHLQPTENDSLWKFKEFIKYHHRILLLAEDVNNIFTPTLVFSLAASSFILCFSAYQLLDDVSFAFAFKILLLLCFELKQVCITCYFGDKLMERSSNLFHAIYDHNWIDASPAYKRLVLIMMMRTYRPITLNVAGIVDVSLITLKQVLSTSYQIFAVLKST